jgi:hypothetical protein
MEFTQFESITNFEKYAEQYSNVEKIYTEKIHGCNFSIYIGETIRFASRRCLLSSDTKFHNFQTIFNDEWKAAIIKQKSSDYDEIRFIGELFGSKVLTEIPYNTELDYRVFHATGLKDGKLYEFQWPDVCKYSQLYGLLTVPVLNNNLDWTSRFVNNNQKMEGQCIRIDRSNNSTLFFKVKSEEFLEVVSKGTLGGYVTIQRLVNLKSKGISEEELCKEFIKDIIVDWKSDTGRKKVAQKKWNELKKQCENLIEEQKKIQ